MLFLLLHPVAPPPFQALLTVLPSSPKPTPQLCRFPAQGLPLGFSTLQVPLPLLECFLFTLGWGVEAAEVGGVPSPYKAALNALSLPSVADILESKEQPGMSNIKRVSVVAAVVLALAAAVVTGIIVICFIGQVPRARYYPVCVSHVLSLILPITLHHRWYLLQFIDEKIEA